MPEMASPRRSALRRLLFSLLGVALGVVALVAAGLLWQSRSNGGHQATAGKDAPPPSERIQELTAIEVTRVTPRPLTETVRLSGSIDPVNWTLVKSEVAATLTEVLVREGQTVKHGEVLARFQTQELVARLAEKQSNLEGARAQLVYAEKTHAKNITLRQKDIVAETSLDQTQSTLQFQQATVRAMTAQVELARKALDDAVVRAPIDGIIAERSVNPGETLAVNSRMFTLVDLSRVELTANTPTDDVARLKLGQAVELRVEGFGDRVFPGAVARINPVAKTGTRSIPVYVSVDNTDGSLRGGMFANGNAVVTQTAEAIALPPAAVRRDAQGEFVLAVADGRLIRKPIRSGAVWMRGELVQIEGLSADDLVVTAPLPGLQADQAVRVSGG